MTAINKVVPLSLKDAPALIERLLPVQKLSAEAYKEQMANQGKALTALGSYWKGRKPLILNKACILGCLLPATDDPAKDLAIFEMLMAMDDESFAARAKRPPRPKDILASVRLPRIDAYFVAEPAGVLPEAAPIDWSDPDFASVRVKWRDDVPVRERRKLEAQLLPEGTYRDRIEASLRPEEVASVHDHIWEEVNEHLKTSARSFPQLVEQLGLMRFGRRPRLGDTFAGSGQIPFEAARLGCEVYASDLNPIACMLNWGSVNIVGGSKESRDLLADEQQKVVELVQTEVDKLGVETDGTGWRAKAFLYCLEAKCPQSGWMVPLIPSLIISRGKHVIAELVPDAANKRYDIVLRTDVDDEEIAQASKGTVRSDGRGQESYLWHVVNGIEYKTKISTLREDFRSADGSSGNGLRVWEKGDFRPRPDDLFQERLYAIQWMKLRESGRSYDYEFRAVTADDLTREKIVEDFIGEHLAEWQNRGWIPDMKIEPGYNTDQPIRERGWSYWHHLFNPRQLLVNGLINRFASSASMRFAVNQATNFNSKLSQWHSAPGVDAVNHTFYNQALNTFFNYGTRSSHYVSNQIAFDCKHYPLDNPVACVSNHPASDISEKCDIYVTDPPYGDAVNYDEILEFFIAWLRKNPPLEWSDWVWDSRRALAIKGENEDFRRGMVAAYKRMAECMPDNGIQVIMFTHQSSSIWADMANIVWASGLQVTAAWYVVTETESAVRNGNYVKGTVLLVLRKRIGNLRTTRDDLGWDIEEKVQEQVALLTGLTQEAQGLYREQNLFSDADLQMAGYAAALRELTKHSVIDGKEMATEAIRPRVRGQKTFVDELIDFAVEVANRCLVPQGIEKIHWDRMAAVERFYLKMLDIESQGQKQLDNYINFAKAFKVRDYRSLMATDRANSARLKSAAEFGRSEMSEASELYNTVVRGVLYALMELQKDVDGDEVVKHLSYNIPDYFNQSQRDAVVEVARYLAKKLEGIRPEEASAARVLAELVRNQQA